MANHPNRGQIKIGDAVRVKRRFDRDTSIVVAHIDGDNRLVRVDPPLFGDAIYPRNMLVRVSTPKTVTLENFWSGALLEDITLRDALSEMRAKTHPSDQDTVSREIRKAFRDQDGRALFSMLRT
jgi:hypothetical protein